jgi:glycine/D-amino acid oxidase-like deaminating enzyme
MTNAAGRSWGTEALASAQPAVFWMDRPAPFRGQADLDGRHHAELAIVGGGFTGLWAAILAAERDPGRSIVVLEAGAVADGASGRNGGFVADSLCHGLAHGAATWPDELPELLRLGRRNLAELEAFLEAEGIDAGYRRSGKTTLAVAEHQVALLRASARLFAEHGEEAELLDASTVRADVHSPTYLGGLRIRSGYGLVDPARLAWGLARAAQARGVRIVEGARVSDLVPIEGGVRIVMGDETLSADAVIVATNAFPSPLKRVRHFIVPFYDYVLVTEPLSASQWDSIGWDERQGLTDAGNFFHYYRPTDDGRILWGGYDAVYRFGSRVDPSFEQHAASHRALAEHFFDTFPQLEGLRFSHRWGGAIDSTSRFTPLFGTAFDGRVAYAVGYTGLGVASTRFGAAVALDLLDGRPTERSRLSMVRKKPLPFPPEPLRWLAVRVTQSELARQDRNAGRSSLWLRLLDRLGVGFTT